MKVKITPTNIRTGNTAPSYYITVDKNDSASKIDQKARSLSGLGQSEDWKFFV